MSSTRQLCGDVTDKIWEAQRYKKLEVRLIEGSRVSALAHLLLPFFDLDLSKAFSAANMYFSRDFSRSKPARELMSDNKITEEMVDAKALAMQCGQISYIERMVSNREVARNGLLREHERRQRRAARLARKSNANDNEAQAGKKRRPRKRPHPNMASEKQIAANRANAKRSTGPKTAAGRATSSRNAYQHGLSLELPLNDPAFGARMDAMKQALIGGEEPIDQNTTAAAEFAEAQMKLLQIRKVRLDMLAELERECHDLQDFSRLVALDRYERLAHTKRRRAAQNFSPVRKEER